MQYYSVKSAKADTILYAGNFRSLSDCIESGLSEGVSFHGADLRDANLLNAELDGGDFAGANFSGANLTGANLSEAHLRETNFSNAILHSAILCDSDLTLARFDGTLFGGTEIVGATLRECEFSTLSAFTLHFDEADFMENCCFINSCDTICPLSRQPLVMLGLNQFVAVMDRHIKVGHDVFTLDAIPDWIASGGLNPRNLRLRLEQIILALMMDDKRPEIA